VTTLAGGGVGGGTASGYADGIGTAALFSFPQGIAVDASGTRVFVGDTNNHVIRAIVAATGVVTTLAGGGGGSGALTTSFGFADGTARNAQFQSPGGLAIDVAGGLIVADMGNAALRYVDFNGTVRPYAAMGSAASNGYAILPLGPVIFADGTGSNAAFASNSPAWVAVGSTPGLAYVMDTGNAALRTVQVGAGGASS
jgi:DNA-binding beta-propeller fold protein YncE